MIQKNHIGIDVSKESLEVKCEAFKGSFKYNDKGLEKLFAKINTIANPVIACEATGGYERTLMRYAHGRGVPIALINPARVRAFAKSDGLKAKSDPIDAALLLRFAREKDPRITPPPTPQQELLEELMDRRSQLSEALVREKNRLDKFQSHIRGSIEKMIAVLEEELEAIDRQIQETVDEDPDMRRRSEVMQSVTGIGKTTAWSILAYMPQVLWLNRNQAVCLAGLAPFVKESGKYKGKPRIEGGRAKVRKCLFMAAQSAAVHNPHIKAYVTKLRSGGKPYKAAIVAAMRKLLIHLQSLLKKSELCLA